MKVYIGKPRFRWVSGFSKKYMSYKYGYEKYYDMSESEYDFFDKLSEKVEDVLQYIYNKTVNIYFDNLEQSQKVKVKVDDWDVWSMDNTLAFVILPMLKKYKENMKGGPWVEPEDVPEHLRPSYEDTKNFNRDGSTDEKHFERWEYVVDSMIWSFEQINSDWETQFHSGNGDYIFTPVDADGNVVSKEEAKYFRLDHGPDHTAEFDFENYKKHNEKIEYGLTMFGKYYRSLWT